MSFKGFIKSAEVMIDRLAGGNAANSAGPATVHVAAAQLEDFERGVKSTIDSYFGNNSAESNEWAQIIVKGRHLLSAAIPTQTGSGAVDGHIDYLNLAIQKLREFDGKLEARPSTPLGYGMWFMHRMPLWSRVVVVGFAVIVSAAIALWNLVPGEHQGRFFGLVFGPVPTDTGSVVRATEELKRMQLRDAVASLEKAFEAVAASDEATARDLAAYVFDLELQTVSRASSLTSKFGEARDSVDGLQTVVQARLASLGMLNPSVEELRKVRVLDARRRARQNTLKLDRFVFLGVIGHEFKTCKAIYASSANPVLKSDVPASQFLAMVAPSRRALVSEMFGGLIAKCKALDEVEAELFNQFSATGGVIGRLKAKLDNIEREMSKYEVDKQEARNKLKEAIKIFVGADAAAKPAPSKLVPPQERTAMLDEVVKLMEGGSSAFGVAGAQVIAEARLESLQTLLAAIAGTSDDRNVTLSLDQQVAVAIVRDLPGLADDADKLLAHARKPRVAPLIAAVDQQVLITQSYEAVQATNGKRANAARQQLEAALDESLALARVLYALSENRSWGERSISKLDASLPAAAKIAFYRAQATYAAEVQQFRVETEVWVARERAAQYEKELVLSKFAAARWDGLIETLTTMATEYHAHGTNDTNLGKFFKELRLTVELAHTSLREHVALNHAMLAARMDEIRDEAQLAARARARREFENFIDRKAALPARDDPASLMRSFGDEGRKIRERETLALGKIAESSNSDAAILAELPTTKVAAAQNRFGILMQELSPKEWLALAVGYATKIRADVGNLPSQSKHGVWIRRQDSAR